MPLPSICITEGCENLPNKKDCFLCNECLSDERKRKADTKKRKKARRARRKG